MAEDEEEDYMNMVFEDEPKKLTASQRRLRVELEASLQRATPANSC
jgi:hypothetical protein